MKQASQKAFTIVEILVVVVILGIISALVLLAINPAKKINLSKDARVKSDISQIVNSLQTYYANPLSDAKYPSAPDGLDTLIQSGELKSLPNQQEGFVSCPATPGGITTGTTYCYVVSEETEDKVIAVWGTLFSKGLLAWCWDSTTGTFTEKKTGEALPTAENPSCQIALPTSTPILPPASTPTMTPTPTLSANPCYSQANTNWGSGPSGCADDNQRCFNNACISCGGWIYRGYCWYGGVVNQNCTSVCGSHGGVYNGSCDWVGASDCAICLHFFPGHSCYDNFNDFAPCFLSDVGSCRPYMNTGSKCDISASTASRICGCNY